MVTDTACGCYTPLSYCVTLLNYRQKNKFQSTIQNFKWLVLLYFKINLFIAIVFLLFSTFDLRLYYFHVQAVTCWYI